MYKKFEVVHFVGIGGVGMSGIAEVIKNMGYVVRGSDLKETEITRRLRALGIDVALRHKAENITGAHVVVVSSAVSEDNPEVLAAKNQSIPVIPRAEMLAEIARLKQSILIAGAHGKTTTTSLTASVLAEGGLDPTVIIGGKLKSIGSNARFGEGEFLIAETDESDGSFLKLSPTIAVVTNIDREHMDFFKNIDELKNAFLTFINKVPFYGFSILCLDSEYIKELLPKVQRRYITYGLSSGADLSARKIERKGVKTEFEAVLKDKSLGIFEVPLPGLHNVCNCLSVIGVANELQLDMNNVKNAIKTFSGVQRRFEFKGEVAGIKVFDDYGHHPTEIMATLKAAREAVVGGRLVVLFQPHRYSRTRDLMIDFYDAFQDADKVILMDIYSAGEKPLDGISSEVLFKNIKARGNDIEYIKDSRKVISYLVGNLKAGDVFFTLGAGDVWKAGEEFLNFKIQNEKFKID